MDNEKVREFLKEWGEDVPEGNSWQKNMLQVIQGAAFQLEGYIEFQEEVYEIMGRALAKIAASCKHEGPVQANCELTAWPMLCCVARLALERIEALGKDDGDRAHPTS